MHRSPCSSRVSAQSRMELGLKEKASAAAGTSKASQAMAGGIPVKQSGAKTYQQGKRAKCKQQSHLEWDLLHSQKPVLQLSSKKV